MYRLGFLTNPSGENVPEPKSCFCYFCQNNLLMFQLVVTILGFLASGIFIQSSFTEWDEDPMITTMDLIAAPIKDLQFPTLTACTSQDNWAALEIILNFLAFTCSDSDVISTTTNLTYCNDTEMIRSDFKHMIGQILRQSANIVKSNGIGFNSLATGQPDENLNQELALQLQKNYSEQAKKVNHVLQESPLEPFEAPGSPWETLAANVQLISILKF